MTIKALFIIPNKEKLGGCEAYRLMYPARAIEMLGADVTIMDMDQIADEMSRGRNVILFHDIVVMHRTIVINEKEDIALKKSLVAMRANGIAVVVDYDDDYTNQYREVHKGKLPDYSFYNAVSVSTPELSKLMKSFGANVIELKNGIVPELMDANRYLRVIKGISVGLTGSTSHKTDWLPAEQAVLELVEEGLPITIFVSGYIPESLKKKKNVVTMRDLLPGADRDDFFVDLNAYGGIHANIDILLCPVNPDDKFNLFKSNLKAIEGMASKRDVNGKPGGSCVIATGGNLSVYQNAVIHEKTGLLIENHHSVEEWKQAIRKVAMNVEYRNKLQIAGYQLCMKRFDVTKLAKDRLAAYQILVSQAKKDSGKWLAELAHMEIKT
jgi:glycosyltransferase involved in cell wall biosynthesis